MILTIVLTIIGWEYAKRLFHKIMENL